MLRTDGSEDLEEAMVTRLGVTSTGVGGGDGLGVEVALGLVEGPLAPLFIMKLSSDLGWERS